MIGIWFFVLFFGAVFAFCMFRIFLGYSEKIMEYKKSKKSEIRVEVTGIKDPDKKFKMLRIK